jgi:hypothetical protein
MFIPHKKDVICIYTSVCVCVFADLADRTLAEYKNSTILIPCLQSTTRWTLRFLTREL